MYLLVYKTREYNLNPILKITAHQESMNVKRMPYVDTGITVLPDSCGMENRRV